MRYDQPELRDRLAAEYALGTLQGRTRRRLERLMLRDAALAASVEDWQLRLNALAETAPPVEPPAHVWAAIDAALPAEAPVAGDTVVIPFARRPARSVASAWRGGALAAASIAAALAIYVGASRLERPEAQGPVAVLNDQAGHAAFVATFVGDGTRLSLTRVADEQPTPGRVYQLWLLPKGSHPRSLGLVPEARQVAFTLSREDARSLATADGVAISLEPEGGSPTGLPTSPVLFKGAVILPG